MKLYDISGKLRYKSVQKYRIKWDAECRSNLQYEVKQFFKAHWMGQICYEEFPVYGTRMKVDMINMTKRIAVEVQGAQHDSFNSNKDLLAPSSPTKCLYSCAAIVGFPPSFTV